MRVKTVETAGLSSINRWWKMNHRLSKKNTNWLKQVIKALCNYQVNLRILIHTPYPQMLMIRQFSSRPNYSSPMQSRRQTSFRITRRYSTTLTSTHNHRTRPASFTKTGISSRWCFLHCQIIIAEIGAGTCRVSCLDSTRQSSSTRIWDTTTFLW